MENVKITAAGGDQRIVGIAQIVTVARLTI
jgi:hypothetical protein